MVKEVVFWKRNVPELKEKMTALRKKSKNINKKKSKCSKI